MSTSNADFFNLPRRPNTSSSHPHPSLAAGTPITSEQARLKVTAMITQNRSLTSKNEQLEAQVEDLQSEIEDLRSQIVEVEGIADNMYSRLGGNNQSRRVNDRINELKEEKREVAEIAREVFQAYEKAQRRVGDVVDGSMERVEKQLAEFGSSGKRNGEMVKAEVVLELLGEWKKDLDKVEEIKSDMADKIGKIEPILPGEQEYDDDEDCSSD